MRTLQPGPRHLDILDELMENTRAAGNLTTDTHLTALTIEGLRWINPLA